MLKKYLQLLSILIIIFLCSVLITTVGLYFAIQKNIYNIITSIIVLIVLGVIYEILIITVSVLAFVGKYNKVGIFYVFSAILPFLIIPGYVLLEKDLKKEKHIKKLEEEKIE